MNCEYQKNQLEMYKKTLENSVKMYETTLKQMVEKGSSQESISFVLNMKEETEADLNEVNATLHRLEKGEKADFVIAFNELLEKMKTYSPYSRNRFVVDFGTNDIKDFYVEEVNYVGGVLTVLFRDSEEFFAPEYFEGHKQFDKVRIYLLSPIGEKRAVIEFSDVEVESCQTTGLSYKSDDILTTDVFFRYKKESHRTL